MGVRELGAIRKYHSVKLHHIVNARRVGDMNVLDYNMSPLKIRRPDQGSSITDVRCGACDGLISARAVHSIQNTRRARRRWLMMIVLALLMFAGATFDIVRLESVTYHGPMALTFVTPIAWILSLAATVILSFLGGRKMVSA